MFSRSRLAAAFTSALCLVGTVFIPAGAGAIVVSAGPFGGFELDGNQVPGELGTGNLLDWSSQSVRDTVEVVIDDTDDSGFSNGSKELQPGSWQCSTGGAEPGKGDILRAYVNQRVYNNGLYLDLGWVRRDISGDGDVHLNFEFNSGPQTPAAPLPGSCAANRLDGDLLVTYDFPGGTSNPIVRAYTWDKPGNANGNDEGEWVETILDAGTGAGAVNTGAAGIQDYLAGPTPVLVGDRRFGEATLDLGAILARTSPGVCSAFYTANIRSRSSGESWTSSLQDKLPATAVNVSNCGTVQVEKRSDSGALLAGATFQVLAANQTTVVGNCTTDSLGVCSVSNLVPGTYYVRESQAPAGYTGVSGFIGGPLTVSPGGTASVQVSNIRWRYQLTLTPGEDTNLVDNDHVFVATLTRSTNGGTTYLPAAGQQIDFGLVGIGGILGTVPSGPTGGSCTTTAAGTCSITIRSSAPGDSTLSASYDDQVVSTGVEATASAVKHWVNYRIDIAPSGHTNEVGKDHSFTVTLERATDGANWAPVAGINPVISDVSGPGTITGGTCGTTGTDAAGECTVVLSSASAGTDTMSASYHAVVSDTSKTFTRTAVKNWVDYDLVINPDGLHRAGESHTFTAVLTRDTGSGFAPFAGQTVNLAWNGTNGSSLAGSSCVTVADGTCSVVAGSALPANGEVTATWSATLDSGTVSRTDAAVARWVDWAIILTPAQAENLTDTDHTFGVTLTGDSGEGDGMLPIAGANPVFELDGEGDIVSNSCDDIAGTDADGQCEIVVHSDNPGDSFASVGWQGADGAATGTVSASALKDWVTYRLTVSPETSTGPVGTTHQWLVHLEVDHGDGFVNAGSQDIALAVTGVGSVTGVDAGNATSCVTDTAGTCRVNVTSPTPGNTNLLATYHAVAGPTSRDLTDSGVRTWTDIPVTPVEPDDDPEIQGSTQEKPVPAAPVQPAATAPVIPIVAAPIPETPVVAAAPLATLPVTGAGTGSAVRVALGFLAAGLALIAAGRRRQQAES